jgi:hypothetical protein
MSGRSGYTDDNEDQWALIRWRGAVASAIRGKRGQAFLRELAAAMDAMQDKRLVSGELQAAGEFCALGVVGQSRGLDLSKIDTEDWEQLSREFGVSEALAREIMYENDECIWDEQWDRRDKDGGPERWRRVRAWVERHLQEPVTRGKGKA